MLPNLWYLNWLVVWLINKNYYLYQMSKNIHILHSLQCLKQGDSVGNLFWDILQCIRHMGLLHSRRIGGHSSRYKAQVLGTPGFLWHYWYYAWYHHGNQRLWKRTCRASDETYGSTKSHDRWWSTKSHNWWWRPTLAIMCLFSAIFTVWAD